MTGHVTFLRVKALDDGGSGERFIEGWATTPSTDMAGDIVVPEGAKFTLPLPLLWNHDTGSPIGAVVSANVTRAGIRIRAKLTEGVAKAEEVWRLLKDGAINAVSVGFRGEGTPLPTGGKRFDSWTWLELSCCSIPMNPDARVSVAKCAAYSTDAPADVVPMPDKAWLRSIEGKRPNECEREFGYRMFDAAMTLLPPELKHLASIHGFGFDPATGIVTFRDGNGLVFASARLGDKTVSVGKEPIGNGVARNKKAEPEPWIEVARALLEYCENLNARVKGLESEVAERGFRFNGYWREGMKAARGDAYSHDGSLWYACTPTTEAPHVDSLDWRMMARKGKDAR